MQNYASIIAQELNIRPQQTEAVIRLLDEDATVPFIARYRKEATGSLDEVAVTAIRDRLAALKELDKRREAILASLEERGLLTPELRAKVEAADALTVLEDIYLPYRPKRRTRASMAKERGLEPLADQLARQDRTLPEAMAAAYVDAEKGVPDAEAALAGARDILAERFAEDQPARERLRKLFGREGLMRSKAVSGKEEVPDAAKYRDYFAWDEPAAQAPSHRILAMFRGEEEGFLRLSDAGDNRHLVVADGNSYTFLDTGVWSVAHGDHSHYYTTAPSLSSLSLAADHTGHVIKDNGKVAAFADGTGSFAVYDPAKLTHDKRTASSLETTPDTLPKPHHGFAIPLPNAQYLVAVGDSKTRTGAAVVDAQGKTVTESPACPGVHGEAIAKDGAFTIGCTDGALVYKDGKFTNY